MFDLLVYSSKGRFHARAVHDNADENDLLFLTEGKALQIALEEEVGKVVTEWL